MRLLILVLLAYLRETFALAWCTAGSKQTGQGQQIKGRFCWGPVWTKWWYSVSSWWCSDSLYSVSYPFMSSSTASLLWPMYEMKQSGFRGRCFTQFLFGEKRTIATQQGKVFSVGKEGNLGTGRWRAGSNVLCGTCHGYHLLCMHSAALLVECPPAWMAHLMWGSGVSLYSKSSLVFANWLISIIFWVPLGLWKHSLNAVLCCKFSLKHLSGFTLLLHPIIFNCLHLLIVFSLFFSSVATWFPFPASVSLLNSDK